METSETDRLLGEIAAELKRHNDDRAKWCDEERVRLQKYWEREEEIRRYYAQSLELQQENRRDSQATRDDWKRQQREAKRVAWIFLSVLIALLLFSLVMTGHSHGR